MPYIPSYVEGLHQEEFEYDYKDQFVAADHARAQPLDKTPGKPRPKTPKRSVTPATVERRWRCKQLENGLKAEVCGDGQCEFDI